MGLVDREVQPSDSGDDHIAHDATGSQEDGVLVCSGLNQNCDPDSLFMKVDLLFCP